jgi:hypothetical protein
MINGAAIEIRATLNGLKGPVTWSLGPGASGTLIDLPDNLVASYIPTITSASEAVSKKVTIKASAGGVSQSIELDVKPSPQAVTYLDLPKVWRQIFGDFYGITGNPVASAADQSGNLYLAYAALSEIKKVGTDGSITTFAKVGGPTSLAFGPNGVLYVVDRVVSQNVVTLAIRLIAPDGKMSTLTETAPFDYAKGTIDGPPGVATALDLSIVVSPDGTIYATDRSRVRKIAPDGSFSTFAGGGCEVVAGPAPACNSQNGVVNGRGTEARFTSPTDIVHDAAGNLYVNDGALIRKITPAGDVSILAGGSRNTIIQGVDGTGSAAGFRGSSPMAIDPAGNLYLGTLSPMLRKVTPSGVVSTVATGVGGFYPVTPEDRIVSLYAGTPGIVVLQSSRALIKFTVE